MIKELSAGKTDPPPDFEFGKYESVAESLFKKDLDSRSKDDTPPHNRQGEYEQEHSEIEDFGLDSIESSNPLQVHLLTNF